MKYWQLATAVLTMAAIPGSADAFRIRSCNQAAANCQIEGAGKPNINRRCAAAAERCCRTGVFVGPITGRRWNLPKCG
jgi:hypothetical protein